VRINERLLLACSTRAIPHSEVLAMIKPLAHLNGEARLRMQNQIADEIERRYPLRKETADKEDTECITDIYE
jgi:hypothetical protein